MDFFEVHRLKDLEILEMMFYKIPHNQKFTKTSLISTVSNFVVVFGEKSESARRDLMRSDFWERLVVSGIINSNSPFKFNRKRLESIMNGGKFHFTKNRSLKELKFSLKSPLTYSDTKHYI